MISHNSKVSILSTPEGLFNKDDIWLRYFCCPNNNSIEYIDTYQEVYIYLDQGTYPDEHIYSNWEWRISHWKVTEGDKRFSSIKNLNRPISGLATILNFSGLMDFDLGTTNKKQINKKIYTCTSAGDRETVQLNFYWLSGVKVHQSGEI